MSSFYIIQSVGKIGTEKAPIFAGESETQKIDQWACYTLRIIDQFRLEGTSRCKPISCSKQYSLQAQIRLFRVLSKCILKILKDRGGTASLGNLLCCWKNWFLLISSFVLDQTIPSFAISANNQANKSPKGNFICIKITG